MVPWGLNTMGMEKKSEVYLAEPDTPSTLCSSTLIWIDFVKNVYSLHSMGTIPALDLLL